MAPHVPHGGEPLPAEVAEEVLEVLEGGLGVVLLDLVVDLVALWEAVDVERQPVLCLVVSLNGPGVAEGEDGLTDTADSVQVTAGLSSHGTHGQ